MERIPPFRTLDAWRGLAAAWVVIDHCCSGFLIGPNVHYRSELLYRFASRGQLGVTLFFVISGYCITAAALSALNSGKTLGRYAFERVRRIYPPYFAALVLGTCSAALILLANSHHWVPAVHNLPLLSTSVRYWVANVLLLQFELGTKMADSAFWSLCYEIAFYAIVGLMLLLAKGIAVWRGPAAGTMTLMLSITGSTCLSLLVMIVRGRAAFPFDLWHQFALGGVLFFLIEGNPRTVSGDTKRFRWALWVSSAAVLGFTLTFIVVGRIWDGNYAHSSSRAATTLCLAFCIALAGLRRFDARLSSARWIHPLLWLGACSYSLYLIHPIVLPYIDILTRRAGLDGNLYWISVWIQFAAAIAAGRVFYWLVEKRFVSVRQRERLREEHVA